MESEHWQRRLDLPSQKRSSPLLLDYGADSADDFDLELRPRKQPKIHGDQIDQFPVSTEHDVACMDSVEISPLPDGFHSPSFTSNISPVHVESSFLDPGRSPRISQEEENPICCFGMVCEPSVEPLRNLKNSSS